MDCAIMEGQNHTRNEEWISRRGMAAPEWKDGRWLKKEKPHSFERVSVLSKGS